MKAYPSEKNTKDHKFRTVKCRPTKKKKGTMDF